MAGDAKALPSSTHKSGSLLGAAALGPRFSHVPELIADQHGIGEWSIEPGSGLSAAMMPAFTRATDVSFLKGYEKWDPMRRYPGSPLLHRRE